MVNQQGSAEKEEGLATEEFLCLLHEPVARVDAIGFDIERFHYHEQGVYSEH